MKKSLVTLLLSVFFLPLLAQKGLVKKGDEHFKAMAYPSAIPYYRVNAVAEGQRAARTIVAEVLSLRGGAR